VNHSSDNTQTDQQLVKLVLQGNRNAFAQIIRNTEHLVGSIIYRMISHPEDRRDLAQDVYLKAFHKLSGFRFQSKLSTWIAQIAYNTCYSFLDKKKLLITEIEDKIMLPENEIEAHFDNKANSEILQREIERLPPVYKTLIILFHTEEISYAEISLITGLPDGTVKSYLSRARKTLKNNLLQTYSKEAL